MWSAASGSAARTVAKSSLATAAVGAVSAEVAAAVELAAVVEATAAAGAAESAGATTVAGVIAAVEETAGVDVTAAVGVTVPATFAADGSGSDDASAIGVNRRGCALASRTEEVAGPLGVEAMGDTVVISAAPRGVAAGLAAGVRLSGWLATAGTMAIMDAGNGLRDFAGDTGLT